MPLGHVRPHGSREQPNLGCHVLHTLGKHPKELLSTYRPITQCAPPAAQHLSPAAWGAGTNTLGTPRAPRSAHPGARAALSHPSAMHKHLCAHTHPHAMGTHIHSHEPHARTHTHTHTPFPVHGTWANRDAKDAVARTGEDGFVSVLGSVSRDL